MTPFSCQNTVKRRLGIPLFGCFWVIVKVSSSSFLSVQIRNGLYVSELGHRESMPFAKFRSAAALSKSGRRSKLTRIFDRNTDMEAEVASPNTSISESTTVTKENTRALCKIITCSSTKELAHAVSKFVQPGHQVAELGSQLREVSTAICEALAKPSYGKEAEGGKLKNTLGHARLVDVERRFPKSTKDSSFTNSMRLRGSTGDDNVFSTVSTFCEISQLQGWREVLFGTSNRDGETGSFIPSRYDIFVLDANAIVGNDLEWTSLSIAREFEALNNNILDHKRNGLSSGAPLIILVKSMALNRWATRLVPGHQWLSTKGINDAIKAPHIVATVGVQEYRSTIPVTVRPGNAVLEVGCHFGTSTILLHEAASSNVECSDGTQREQSYGYCIGVDVGSKIIQEAKARHPNVYFRVADAWRTAELLRIQQEYQSTPPSMSSAHGDKITCLLPAQKVGFDVVYIDVGGLSGADGILEALSLTSSICFALEPRCVVIKSQCMRNLASNLVPYWQIRKQQESKMPN